MRLTPGEEEEMAEEMAEEEEVEGLAVLSDMGPAVEHGTDKDWRQWLGFNV